MGTIGFEAISIEAIVKCAGVGKTTVYRRYSNKEELIADAIENIRQEVVLPDTGNLWNDLDVPSENAAKVSLTPLGRQTVAMIISSATHNTQFAKIYQAKYLQPRREAFVIVIERAKTRNEIQASLDSRLVFDCISGIMLYGLIFQSEKESWQKHVRRALQLLLQEAFNEMHNPKKEAT